MPRNYTVRSGNVDFMRGVGFTQKIMAVIGDKLTNETFISPEFNKAISDCISGENAKPVFWSSVDREGVMIEGMTVNAAYTQHPNFVEITWTAGALDRDEILKLQDERALSAVKKSYEELAKKSGKAEVKPVKPATVTKPAVATTATTATSATAANAANAANASTSAAAGTANANANASGK